MSMTNSSILGPNTHGVPENYPWLAADPACHKCHGTGYKKKLITRRWTPCKKCSKKYGWDVNRVDLKNLGHHETATTTAVPLTSTTYTMIPATTMIGTTAAGTMPTTTTMIGTLPSGFQTLPANPQCVKCSGTGYRRSTKAQSWKGCKVCAQQYGTNLSTVVIPTTTSTMVGTGTTASSNILY